VTTTEEVSTTGENDPVPVPAGQPRTRRRLLRSLPGRPVDRLVTLVYLAGALYVMGHLLVDPNGRVQLNNRNDSAFFRFVLAHSARVLTHGEHPFFTRQMNAPDGVNLMANTSILGLALPLSPVTLLFGAPVAYLVLSVLALAATATSWYALLARHVVRSRLAAFFGGALCGLGPSSVAQANGHPNIVAQFLVPWIVWRALRLREPGQRLRNAAALAALVVWQFFINEEVLLLTAVGLGVVALVHVLWHRRTVWPDVRRFLGGVAVAAAMTLVVLAYPLWFQFFGPQHYRGLPPLVQVYGIDLWAYVSYASESVSGNPNSASLFTANAAEQNGFLGWGLVLLLAVIVWRLRRSALVVGLAAAALTFVVLSPGDTVLLHGHRLATGPWALLSKLPLFDTLVAPRLALAVTPIAGMLLALGCDRFLAWTAEQQQLGAPFRLAGAAVLAVALVPIAPTPLPAVGQPIPAFITQGYYRDYVPPGRSLVTVPLPRPPFVDALYFDAATRTLDFAFPRGYFLGPGVDPAHPDQLSAVYGAPPRPTSTLLEGVAFTGVLPPVGPVARAAARADLGYWRAAALILPFGVPHEEQLYRVTTELVGFPPTSVGGVWLWDVRALVPPAG
jgi:hypothetical protein